MIGLGTLVNAAAVLAGGGLGLLLRGGLKQRFQDILMQALGLSVVFIGAAGVFAQLFAVKDSLLNINSSLPLVLSLVFGAILGELIDLHNKTERLGEWLKQKFRGRGDGSFVEGFVTASLTVCVGAMAVVGSLEDGLRGEHTTLFTKALLDGFIIMVLASVFGKGALFSALPLALLQGSITLLARFIAPYITPEAVDGLSLVGSALIFCVGTNLLFQTKIRVANLLPSLALIFIYYLF